MAMQMAFRTRTPPTLFPQVKGGGKPGASVSKETISRITDKVLEEMQSWQNRPLDQVYAAAFVDAIVVKVRDGCKPASST